MKKDITLQHAGKSLYDSDFFAWTEQVAEQLREGRLSEADREHAAEELADMGKRDRRELRSRMTTVVIDLMKWAKQPKKRTPSWLETINEQRDRLKMILDDSPSLWISLGRDEMLSILKKAQQRAGQETGLGFREFFSPYLLELDAERVLAEDFLPEDFQQLSIARSS